MKYIDHTTVGNRLSWDGVVKAMQRGHLLPKAQISDQFLTRDPDTLLSRAAWINGLGFGVKSVSVMPNNPTQNLPTVQGAMLVFEDKHGTLDAIIDSNLVTKWKTAGDSVFGASLLARPNSETYLIVGAGVVAETLIEAYSAQFPNIKRIEIWNRTPEKASQLAAKFSAKGLPVFAASDLKTACQTADIISTATMSKTPLINGDWIKPGTHIDLIGAFKADMREADDALLQMGRLFVDSFDTTLDHIGELMIPLASGAIARDDILGDYYDLVQGVQGREANDDITILKNGGGAHLDLMTAKYILEAL